MTRHARTTAAAHLLTALVAGCSSSSGEPGAPRPVEYTLDSCAHYDWKGTQTLFCHDEDNVTEAHCEVTDGALETSVGLSPHQWECAETSNDPAKGAWMCIHVTCESK